jgi:CRP-like cAMP-binding protein
MRSIIEIPSNLILQGLPPDELARFLPRLTPVALEQHDVVQPVGAPIEHAFFVEAGLVSLLVVGRDGDAIETGVVGSEGVVGGVVVLNSSQSPLQATVQIAGRGLRAPIRTFLDMYRSSAAMRGLVHKHLGVLLLQAQQNAACHALHSVEARLCRWLLQAQDIVDSDVLDLTQEFLSHMLGVQRTSVSMIAHSLQNAGLIRYSRGKIHVLDRPGLERTSCECYRLIREQIEGALAPAA